MQTEKKLQGHQGDVQFKYINQLPAGAKKITNKPIALGEKSGHMHVLTGPAVEMFEYEGRIYTVIGSDGAMLQHCHESHFTAKCWTSKEEIQKADHGAHSLPPGIVEFWIQNAYNPYKKLMEKVVD
jgi:hypothetical protein